MIVLSVFLVYCVPATGAEPPVLLVGVNPWHNLALPAVPVKVKLNPSNVSGGVGTNLFKTKLSSSIESFVKSACDIDIAPVLKLPLVGTPITWSQ